MLPLSRPTPDTCTCNVFEDDDVVGDVLRDVFCVDDEMTRRSDWGLTSLLLGLVVELVLFVFIAEESASFTSTLFEFGG